MTILHLYSSLDTKEGIISMVFPSVHQFTIEKRNFPKYSALSVSNEEVRSWEVKENSPQTA